MSYIVRPIRQDEWPLLEDFLYEAIFLPEGFEGELPRSVIHGDPKRRAAFEGFGTLPDDRALVAEVDGEVIGACWVRTTDGYGHIDSATPSFSISIYKPYRGRGIGTAMMSRMLDELLEAGYTRASLSVQKENPALRLYERMGFRIVGDGADETEWLMVRDLCGHEISSATLDSADTIYRLVQTTIHAVYPDCYDPAVVAAFSCLHSPDVIRADIAAGKIFILKVGDRILGTGTVEGNHIMRVFVRLWWKCSTCGQSWQASVDNRNKGTGCPVYANRVVVEGINDLATTNPELAAEWNHDRNGDLRPSDIAAGTRRRIWWKCLTCGHEWQATASDRNSGRGCPKCANKRRGRRKRSGCS